MDNQRLQDLNNYLNAEYWRLKHFQAERTIIALWILIASLAAILTLIILINT